MPQMLAPPPQGESLADSRTLRERFLDFMRGKTQAVVPTIERQAQADTLRAIQNAGVDIDRSRPPVVMPRPAAPQGYSVEDIIRDAQANRPKYDAAGNRIR